MNEEKELLKTRKRSWKGENIVENNQKQEAVMNCDCPYPNIYSDWIWHKILLFSKQS